MHEEKCPVITCLHIRPRMITIKLSMQSIWYYRETMKGSQFAAYLLPHKISSKAGYGNDKDKWTRRKNEKM